MQNSLIKVDRSRDFPGGLLVKNPPRNAGDPGSPIPGWRTKNPTCLGATKPVHLNYWAHASQAESVHCNESSCMMQTRSNTAK